MKLKRVSFEVAKALKEAGYPQEETWFYSPDGRIGEVIPDDEDIAAPYVMKAWLWLWREKGLKIFHDVRCDIYFIYKEDSLSSNEIYSESYDDPEKAIIRAIEYLVDNDLIK